MDIGIARARCERGVAHLNKVRPGWWELVDPDKLNFSQSERCVIGQIVGHYNRGRELCITSRRQASEFGFIAHGDRATINEETQMLTEVWREVLLSYHRAKRMNLA